MTIAPDIDLDTFTPEPPKRKSRGGLRAVQGKPKSADLHPYYDYGPILSHNAEWMFIVGGRGLGKTYGAKKRAITRAIEQGEMFIYLRRHKPELVKSKETFFADVAWEFPAWEFRTNGNAFEMAPITTKDDKKRKWTLIGYAIALSTAQQSKSVAFPLVKTIIFDEFIKEEGLINYLPNEAEIFKGFYSTVDRWTDKTRVFFLANAVSIANPYFIKFGILPDIDTRWMKLNFGKAKGYIVVHFPDAKEFADSVSRTRFGQFIDDTEFGEFAIGNKFADNTNALVGVKNSSARPLFNFETANGPVSLWQDAMRGVYFVYQRLLPGQTMVTMNMSSLSDNTILLMSNDALFKRLKSATVHKRVRYENALVRAMWFDVIDKAH